MRIACPDCNAVYEVPAAALGVTLRRLRCARCGHEWAPDLTPPPPPAAPAARFEPAPAAPVLPPRPEPPPARAPRRSGGATVALLLSLLVLCGLAGAAYTWRAQVMIAWPPSQRVYLLLGVR